MTKPHEETWEVFEANKGFPAFAARTRTIADGAYEVSVIESLSGSEDDVGRVQLAAQAPAMARLLLKLQWASSHPHDETMAVCPNCGGFEARWSKDRAAGHEDHCELVAILRAAGVLP